MSTSDGKKKRSRGRRREREPREVTAQEVPPQEPGSREVGDDLVVPASEMERWRERALRAQAEMANMRRRMEEEVEDRTRRRLEALFHELITLADHLQLALDALPEELAASPAARPFVEGVRAIQRSLRDTMQRFGLESIEPQPEHDFDPEHHEAVHVEEQAGLEAPRLDVLRPGYRMGRRILRPAQVRLLRPAGPVPAGSGGARQEDGNPDEDPSSHGDC